MYSTLLDGLRAEGVDNAAEAYNQAWTHRRDQWYAFKPEGNFGHCWRQRAKPKANRHHRGNALYPESQSASGRQILWWIGRNKPSTHRPADWAISPIETGWQTNLGAVVYTSHCYLDHSSTPVTNTQGDPLGRLFLYLLTIVSAIALSLHGSHQARLGALTAFFSCI